MQLLKRKNNHDKTILSNGGIIEEDLAMTAKEWLEKNNIDLKKYHGNVGDYEGNICIEQTDGTWIFWNSDGKFEIINA